MNANHWEAELDRFEEQLSLLEPLNLQQRMQVLKSLDELMRFGRTRYGIREGFRMILPRAVTLRKKLEQVNQQLFDEIREQIQQKRLVGADLRSVLDDFTPYTSKRNDYKHFGDALNRSGLDSLINGVFETATAPEPTLDAIAEMIHLEMTPMSVVLELVDRVPFTPDDCFVDIGSGQGQICLLVHLLTGVSTQGFDIEPAYVHRAAEVADTILGDSQSVTFAVSDARDADYTKGTVFFLYTPFIGEIFHAVMAQLHDSIQTHPRKIRVCSYGDITLEIGQQPWLHIRQPSDLHPFRLAVFEHIP